MTHENPKFYIISVFLPLTALKLLTVATAMLNNFALLETKMRILNSPIFHVS